MNRAERDALEAADEIISDLSRRRGLKQEWGQIDGDVKQEIRESFAEIVRHALAQSGEVRAGWKLVPVEPTQEMIEAGCIGEPTMAQETEDVYRVMLAATPEPDGEK